MRRLFAVLLSLHFSDIVSSARTKRADPVPWHTLAQLNRIIQASNTRAMDIENLTKQAAIRQNQQNALIASSTSVLSPMAALAMANSRFSPPDIVPMVRADANRDLLAKYAARTRIFDSGDLMANRQLILGADLLPAFPMRDIPPPLPPPIQFPTMLPRMLQPKMRTRGIAVVETPLSLDEPATRIFPRPTQPKNDEEEPREKLPLRLRANESKRKDYVDYIFI